LKLKENRNLGQILNKIGTQALILQSFVVEKGKLGLYYIDTERGPLRRLKVFYVALQCFRSGRKGAYVCIRIYTPEKSR